MSFQCIFLFHGSLADFLAEKEKGHWLPYSAKTPSSIKDAIEAQGIPHVEVMEVSVNGKEEFFDDLLQPGDRIEVFPFVNHFPDTASRSFVLDVHLGKLARLLRMLGIDSFYQNNLSDKEIVSISVEQKRTVLTRDIGLLKHKVLQHGRWLRSQQSTEQLMEVVKWFSLCSRIRPFSRCIACNGELNTVSKEAISQHLPPQTKAYFRDFYQCTGCRKVYWKGSHYQNMLKVVEQVRSVAC